MKKLVTIFLFIQIFIFQGKAADLRSDSFDILNININLSLQNFSGKTISANTTVTFKPKIANQQSIGFDLLKLDVTQVLNKGLPISFSYNDTLLRIFFTQTLVPDSIYSVEISYNGSPVQDASGWGGWYWSGVYAFNLGVGFAANPHNYGRVWFPCFDNFIERQTFDFVVAVPSGYMAICNGELKAVNYGSATDWYTWHMEQPIPSYLACINAAPYVTVESVYQSIDGRKIPVWLNALSSDTNNVKLSFAKLDTCIRLFENLFGKYPFEKIGFSMVPFNNGAMEHATNVAFPIYGANGSLNYETLWAHELSHMWWGNNTTCSTAEDMWLNEGWAAYCEKLFLEKAYGIESYHKAVASNHRYVLQYAHLSDSSYYPVSPLPHKVTYGDHAYKKGADMIHSLRSFIGNDSLFFESCRELMKQYALSPINTDTLIKVFNKVNPLVGNFINQWIRTPGWAHFAVDSFQTIKSGADYLVKIFVRQRAKLKNTQYNGCKQKIRFYQSVSNFVEKEITLNDVNETFSFILSFKPVLVVLDNDNLYSDAVNSQTKAVSTTGLLDIENCFMRINVTQISDPALLRIEHHWMPAEGITSTSGLFLSNTRYWSVDGVNLDKLVATANLFYDGSASVSAGSNGCIDLGFIKSTEDSLVLMYRPDAGSVWTIENNVNKITGNKIDRKGYFTLQNLRKGQYAFAMFDNSLGSKTSVKTNQPFIISPNPSSGKLHLLDVKSEDVLIIFDNLGKQIGSYSIENSTLSLEHLPSGIYYVMLYRLGVFIGNEKLIVKH